MLEMPPKRCSMYCPDFTPRLCDRLKKPPYVCNDCPQIRSCSHDFYFYRANYANDIYSETKSSSRSGINQTPESLEQLDRLVSPLLLQGQPLSHIFASNQDSVSCSIRTLYNYIDQGYFTAINLDLPRKVRYKKRRKARREPDNTGYRKGRSYQDFERYLEKFPDTNVVELDVVEGAGGKSEKVLLTMLFRNCSLMLISSDGCRQTGQRGRCVSADIHPSGGPICIENFFLSFLQTMELHSKTRHFLNGLKVNFCPMSFTATQWLPGRRDAWKRITNLSVISSQKV